MMSHTGWGMVAPNGNNFAVVQWEKCFWYRLWVKLKKKSYTILYNEKRYLEYINFIVFSCISLSFAYFYYIDKKIQIMFYLLLTICIM